MALDDGKGVPVGQQPASANLPPSNVQASQQHASQTGGQPQQLAGQGPQQTYPSPMPYYFPHAYSQNQYYGTPYSSGYVPQPFVKYPAMFQPGPPGPASANSPAASNPVGTLVNCKPILTIKLFIMINKGATMITSPIRITRSTNTGIRIALG
jgi:hypothetical protein